MADTKTKARYALAILALILFPSALVGGALQASIYNAGDRSLPLEWVRDYRSEVDPYYSSDARSEVLAGCENGDVIIAGTTWSETYYWLMRVSADGRVAWLNPDSPHSNRITFFDFVKLAPDRYLIIGERDTDYNGTVTWLLCIDDLGEEVWNRTFADFGGRGSNSAGVACSDGGALIISSITSNATGEDLCALRIDQDGAALWNLTYPGPWPWEYVLDAASASDGSILFLAFAMNSSSNYCILRCLEPTGALRWNQTGRAWGVWFDSVASGNGGDYVLTSRLRAVCLDPEGRERWRTDFALSESSGDRVIVACENGYFILSSAQIPSVEFSWEGFLGLSIDVSGMLRWSWSIELAGTRGSDCTVAASGNGGLYILPESSCLLVRLLDPPALTSMTALLAESGYALVILSSMIVTVLVSRYLAPNATRRRSDSEGYDPRVLLKASFILQAGLLLCWGLLILFFGPVRSYYESYHGSVGAETVLLFLLVSPVGITSGILGALAFAALQLGVFPLDQQWSLELQQRHQSKAPSILTCACLVFVVFLGFYSIAWPAYYLAMLPFVNGAILVGFLPKYLLLRRWS